MTHWRRDRGAQEAPGLTVYVIVCVDVPASDVHVGAQREQRPEPTCTSKPACESMPVPTRFVRSVRSAVETVELHCMHIY